MGWVHGRHTKITVATKDISPYCNTSEFTKGGDKHDVTGYGATDHEFGADGLGTGEFTCGGTYDNTASVGPHNALDSLVNTIVVITRKPEGNGTGKPLQTFSAFFDEYKETNPVENMVKWAAKFTKSGPVADTVQA